MGLSIGSFLNVVLYRIPSNKSIIYPNSFCPNCKNKILLKDNIPLISWLFLKAKCRYCNQKISFIYPSIELLTGLLFIIVTYGDSKIYELLPLNYFIYISWLLISISIPLFIFDLRYYWLPKSIIIFGSLSGLLFTCIYSIYFNNYLFFRHIISGTIGFLFFYIANLIGKRFFKKNVIGNGDMKLIFMFGIWLGMKGILLSIYLSFLFSGLICFILILLKKIKKGQIIPFGPFIIISSLSIWFLGSQFFLDFYDNLI